MADSRMFESTRVYHEVGRLDEPLRAALPAVRDRRPQPKRDDKAQFADRSFPETGPGLAQRLPGHRLPAAVGRPRAAGRHLP